MSIRMHPVSSSNLKLLGYHEGHLHVEFKDGTRGLYLNVPSEEVAKLVTANSVGSHLHQNIKGKYTWEKITS